MEGEIKKPKHALDLRVSKKSKHKISYVLNLLVLNYLIWSLGFIPTSRAYFQTKVFKQLQPKTITVEKIVEKDLEPENPDAWVAWRIARAGLNPLEAMVIVTKESGYENNDNKYNTNRNGSVDLGRWQWNSVHIDSGFITIECAGNYKCATDKAIAKRLHDGNWSAWYGSHGLGIN